MVDSSITEMAFLGDSEPYHWSFTTRTSRTKVATKLRMRHGIIIGDAENFQPILAFFAIFSEDL